MKSGKVRKVFTIVLMPNHWGAFYVDVAERTIDFGDSLNKAIPDDALEAIKRWLELTGQDLSLWRPPAANSTS